MSGGESITGSTYIPDAINTDTTVVIRYTIGADRSCAATFDDVTFTVTPICPATAVNTTSTASISEGETRTLTGTPSGGSWSLVSSDGSILGSTYTADNINTNTTVVVSYTIVADGSCAASSDDVSFTFVGSIGDTVWYDSDGDGIKDAGENGLGGATVTLDPGTPSNPNDDVTTITDTNGTYLFPNIPAGNYTVNVDVSSVTSGIPSDKTVAELIPIFDTNGLGTPHTSAIILALGEDNLDQDFGYGFSSDNVGCGGNCGGVESESLGDAISKIYLGRKKKLSSKGVCKIK